ncbi:transglutaminase domain-containing protein [Streptococcus parasuis]|uniref:transglutaminase domain-containing protein n=1 Tax=Streptococcus parasuis TaxID=1501662 RepID=UPI0025A4E9D1|nr:transglutaminase domain-containing protein [Streptococcus parasuis]WJQ85908.1 transglutaminase domain-containing protein [Streptococcus parasuis]
MKKKSYLIILIILACTQLTGCSYFPQIEDFSKVISGEASQEAKVLENELQQMREEVADNFYYQQLDTNEERRVYLQLANGLRTFKQQITIDRVDEETYTRAFFSVANDFPEYYWMTDAMRDGIDYQDLSEPDYPLQVEEESEKIATLAQSIVSQAPKDHVYDTVKFFYEYIIQHTDYNLAALSDSQISWDNQSIKSVLLANSSVCAGYSRTFQYLCKLAGIEAVYVSGKVTGTNGETIEHAWNLVKIDQHYYGVDSTWGDPVFEEAMGSQVQSTISYDYLCVPDSILYRNRVADVDLLSYWGTEYPYTERPLAYPSCTDNALNYYVQQGTYFENFDEELIVQTISNLYQAGQHRIACQFSNQAALDQMVEYAASGTNRLFEVLGWIETYQYLYNEQTLTFELVVE